MSRGAYEAHFGQAAPAGAIFGVDVSWWQSGGSYATTAGYWADFGTWADFVCVRVSYGATGDDGAQDLHFQVAADRGYQGAMGPYHFVYASSSAAANVANYLARSEPFVGRTSFDMLDFEVAPVPSAAWVNEACDRVEQARQRPCLIYGGYSYLNQVGAISCPASKLWTAHYAASGSNAWVPTTDPTSWDAPLIPAQYAGQYPGVWQWSSLTPQHGHLDLNISTNPDLFYGGSLGAASVNPNESLWRFLVTNDELIAQLNRIEVNTGQVIPTQMGQHVNGIYVHMDQDRTFLQQHGDANWTGGPSTADVDAILKGLSDDELAAKLGPKRLFAMLLASYNPTADETAA